VTSLRRNGTAWRSNVYNLKVYMKPGNGGSLRFRLGYNHIRLVIARVKQFIRSIGAKTTNYSRPICLFDRLIDRNDCIVVTEPEKVMIISAL
jgi:hypothetical protein